MNRRGKRPGSAQAFLDDDQDEDEPLGRRRQAAKRGQAGEPNMQGPGQVSASLRGRV